MSENWKIQISPKTADGTLVNLRAETPDEAERILSWAIENAPRIQEAVAAVLGANTVAAAFPGPGTQVVEQQGPWSQQGSQQGQPPAFVPQQAAPAEQPAGRMCTHGAMVYREAKPGSGKSWKAYFCPTPKDTPGQCQPQFLKG